MTMRSILVNVYATDAWYLPANGSGVVQMKWVLAVADSQSAVPPVGYNGSGIARLSVGLNRRVIPDGTLRFGGAPLGAAVTCL